jgi:hypothetical protein
MSLLAHENVCDLAKLTMLVYNYGKNFEIGEENTIEDYVKESDLTENPILENDIRNEALESLSKSSPHGKVHKFYSIDTTDLQVGITISETNKRICVVFRGSESKYDWYYDLSVFKIKLHDNVYVHGGFYAQLHNENMYENIKNDVRELCEQNKDYSVYITGHSLGAALSTLCGYELARDLEKDITVVSFASPRVGNPEFRKEFDKRENLTHYRISNDRDIVTAAPMINFQHVGINISLCDEKYEVFYNYEYNGWFRFSLFNCWRVSDHDMDLYFKRIKKHKW